VSQARQYRIGCKPGNIHPKPDCGASHAGLYFLSRRRANDDGQEQAKYNMAKITVKIEDGMVQMIEGIPTDVTIEVRNYDVSDVDEKMVTKDENGKSCEIREWQAPE
jgi:hypothetical protein